ncbi:unnamed protein product [Closterium sp. NIES-65]|nr:unnamed protein product [Closterium sp. NIES-65]
MALAFSSFSEAQRLSLSVAGARRGAYAKNSYGNEYSAVGVWVLGETLRNAWGEGVVRQKERELSEYLEVSGPGGNGGGSAVSGCCICSRLALRVTSWGEGVVRQKQRELSEYLERHRMAVGMELVTAVLGDHGQRPLQDYVVVTAVTDMASHPPRFLSTPEVLRFCHTWRLPFNSYWLFHSTESCAQLFAAYNALSEEGTAHTVEDTLTSIADVTIAENYNLLFAPLSSPLLLPPLRHSIAWEASGKHHGGAGGEAGEPRSLQQVSELKAVLRAGPAASYPVGAGTRLRELFTQHDSMREVSEAGQCRGRSTAHRPSGGGGRRRHVQRRALGEGVAGGMGVEASRLLSRLKKSTFESTQKGEGVAGGMGVEARTKLLKVWGTSPAATHEMTSALPSMSTQRPSHPAPHCLSLQRSPQPCPYTNSSDFALPLCPVHPRPPNPPKSVSSNSTSTMPNPFLLPTPRGAQHRPRQWGAAWDGEAGEGSEGKRGDGGEGMRGEESGGEGGGAEGRGKQGKGLLVFFPGIPAEQAWTGREGESSAQGARDGGDASADPVVGAEAGAVEEEDGWQEVTRGKGKGKKGKYWKVLGARMRKERGARVNVLADKNAPNEDVWNQIEAICHDTGLLGAPVVPASLGKLSFETSQSHDTGPIGVPVVPASLGTLHNAFDWRVLAVFLFRVIQRTNHPGDLDASSPAPGQVVLNFHSLYTADINREDFEAELKQRFGVLVTMPVQGASENAMAEEVLEWEGELRAVLHKHAHYLTSIQLPLDQVVATVQNQLHQIATGQIRPLVTTKTSFRSIRLAAVVIDPAADVAPGGADKEQGVPAVVGYAPMEGRAVTVLATALLFDQHVAALAVELREGEEGEAVRSLNPFIERTNSFMLLPCALPRAPTCSHGSLVRPPIRTALCCVDGAAVRLMMYGFGDDPEPLPESVELVEEIVIEYITDLVHRAQEVAARRGRLTTEDVLFLIRKDPRKFARARELLAMNVELKEARKAFQEEQ